MKQATRPSSVGQPSLALARLASYDVIGHHCRVSSLLFSSLFGWSANYLMKDTKYNNNTLLL